MNKFTLWFLRMFPQFRAAETFVNKVGESHELAERWRKECDSTTKIVRDLRRELAEAKNQQLLIQDRLESALADKSRIWDLFNDAYHSSLSALRMQVNDAYKTKWGTTPYPEEWAPPDNLTRDPNRKSEPMGRGFTPPSEMVRRQTVTSLPEMLERQKQGA